MRKVTLFVCVSIFVLSFQSFGAPSSWTTIKVDAPQGNLLHVGQSFPWMNDIGFALDPTLTSSSTEHPVLLYVENYLIDPFANSKSAEKDTLYEDIKLAKYDNSLNSWTKSIVSAHYQNGGLQYTDLSLAIDNTGKSGVAISYCRNYAGERPFELMRDESIVFLEDDDQTGWPIVLTDLSYLPGLEGLEQKFHSHYYYNSFSDSNADLELIYDVTNNPYLYFSLTRDLQEDPDDPNSGSYYSVVHYLLWRPSPSESWQSFQLGDEASIHGCGDIAYDRNFPDVLHIAYSGTTYVAGDYLCFIDYVNWTPGVGLSEIQRVYDFLFSDYQQIGEVCLANDPVTGFPRIAYQITTGTGGEAVFYVERGESGIWSEPSLVCAASGSISEELGDLCIRPDNQLPAISMLRYNNEPLLYCNMDTLYYERQLSGNWSESIVNEFGPSNLPRRMLISPVTNKEYIAGNFATDEDCTSESIGYFAGCHGFSFSKSGLNMPASADISVTGIAIGIMLLLGRAYNRKNR